MASITVDKVVKGNVVMHDHSLSDLTTILENTYLTTAGITDTNSINLTATGAALSADLIIQDTTSVDLAVDASGLKATVLPAGVDHNSLANLTSGDPHTQYLEIVNNLSDLNDAATARTNLGLVSGGAGDIWVKKASDTMTGALGIGTTPLGILDIKGEATSIITGTATPTNYGVAVTGTGTAFTTELTVGDQIQVNSQTRMIVAIADDTNLTLEQELNSITPDASVNKYPVISRVLNASGTLVGLTDYDGRYINFKNIQIKDTTNTDTNVNGLQLYHTGNPSAAGRGMGIRWYFDRDVPDGYSAEFAEMGAIICKRTTSSAYAPTSIDFWTNPGLLNGYMRNLSLAGNLITVNPDASLDFSGFYQYNGAWTMDINPYNNLTTPRDEFTFKEHNTDHTSPDGWGMGVQMWHYISGAYYRTGSFHLIQSTSATFDWVFRNISGGVNNSYETLRLGNRRVGINSGGAGTIDSTLEVIGTNANIPIGVLRGFTSQMSDLLQLQDIGETVLYGVEADGEPYLYQDSKNFYWGAGKDAGISYDGTNLLITPDLVGTGFVRINTAQASALVIGKGSAGIDYQLTFDGETNDGVLTWQEDEDYFRFNDDIDFSDAENISFGTTTGSKIGTATTQKLGFWNATPIVQPVTNAYISDGEGSAYTGIDNAQVGTVYAQLADLNTLRVAYETLRSSYDDLLTKLKTTGIVA